MMETYLAVTPDKLTEALSFTSRVAHMAYRVDEEGRLAAQSLPPSVRGGMMVLGDGACGTIAPGKALAEAVWRECAGRGFGAVLADFEKPPSPDRVDFLRALSEILARQRRMLFVPESYGEAVDRARVLLCTAVSGGTVAGRLEEGRRRFGGRLALDLQRLRMEFPLPCPGGEGRALDGEELTALLHQKPEVFYSRDLGAKYFTCPRGDSLGMILFDDADTLKKKLRLAASMGIGTAFLVYPEAQDLLPTLYGR